MNKFYLLLLFVTSFVSAQIVTIPDANFKAKLLSASSTNSVAYKNGFPTKIDTNNDNQIQASEAAVIDSLKVNYAFIYNLQGINSFSNLKKLEIYSNSLTTLDISSLTSLIKFNAYQNELIAVDLTNNTQLQEINLSMNQLQSIDVSNLFNLNRLQIYSNQLTSISVTGNLLLEELNIKSNQISSLNLASNSNLKNLNCGENLISSIDVSQNLNLEILNLHNTNVANIDVSQNINLIELGCMETPITSLDISNNTSLVGLGITNNPFLVYLNLKNGKSQSGGIITGVDNLLYACVDEFEQQMMEAYLPAFVNINTYCSFTPEGNFNTISGNTKIDANNDGCDVSDPIVRFLGYAVTENGNPNTQVYSDYFGNYAFFTDHTGSFTFEPNLEEPDYFTISPIFPTLNISQIDNTTPTQNFCISPIGIQPDLEVVLVPIIPARPGFDAVYKIVYKNKGNQIVDGSVNLTFNDAVLDFVTSSVVPTSISGSTYNWNVGSLAPFQAGSILVTFNVNSPQEIPAVNIDDVLTFNVNINLITDVMANDNSFDLNQTVVGSFDPNDITCLQGNALPLNDIGKYLHYNIRFENTGTAPAENIVVKNTIDLTQYNIQSLQVMETSHPVTVKVTGNIAEFIFQSIDLDTGGHGNILLKLKSNNSLSQNVVINSADIFFDYNFPIVTNDEQTVFADLSKDDFNKDASIQVYPNPAVNVVHIKTENTIKSIQLFDAQGRLLITKMANENVQNIDLTNYASGIYFVSVSTSVGKQTYKIIKK